jgi:hypothetical protein
MFGAIKNRKKLTFVINYNVVSLSDHNFDWNIKHCVIMI